MCVHGSLAVTVCFVGDLDFDDAMGLRRGYENVGIAGAIDVRHAAGEVGGDVVQIGRGQLHRLQRAADLGGWGKMSAIILLLCAT